MRHSPSSSSEDVHEPGAERLVIGLGAILVLDQRHRHVLADNLVSHRAFPDPVRILEPVLVNLDQFRGRRERVAVLDDREQLVAARQARLEGFEIPIGNMRPGGPEGRRRSRVSWALRSLLLGSGSRAH
jgi:hypothetical protein